MNISFVWIGGEIPPPFLENYKTAVNLNPHHSVRLFQTNDIQRLATAYGILDVFKTLNFVNQINLSKYLVLHYYPGLYSDIDIKWKKPIGTLINDTHQRCYNNSYWPNHEKFSNDPEWISCIRPFTYEVGGEYCYTFDDHLIYAKENSSQKLIEFCLSRLAPQERDSNFYFEPFGPISITKMIYNKQLSARMWIDKQVQGNGDYCIHESTRLWDPTKIL